MQPDPYSFLMLAGIAISILFWSRLARRDDRLLLVYVAALVGAFLGAKIVYILAEGWLHFGAPDMWLQLATGKSILGALLGGYAGVELAKKWVGYPGMTGDWFAFITPISIIVGRIGCLLHGCCLGVVCEPAWFTLKDANGVARWPAVPVEIFFNALAVGCFFVLRHNQTTARHNSGMGGGRLRPEPPPERRLQPAAALTLSRGGVPPGSATGAPAFGPAARRDLQELAGPEAGAPIASSNNAARLGCQAPGPLPAEAGVPRHDCEEQASGLGNPHPDISSRENRRGEGGRSSTDWLRGQHFHLYLIAYGAFRFVHEFVRQEPHILGPLSGYQLAALAVFALGLVRFAARQKQNAEPLAAPVLHLWDAR